MAAIKAAIQKGCQFLNKNAAVLRISQNGMSQYPTYYINPIYNPSEQKALYESGEAQKLAHVPTRAVLGDITCMARHDDLVNLMINYVMRDGEKILARGLVDDTLANIKRMQLEKYHKCQTKEQQQEVELNPKVIMYKAIDNCKPILYLTPIKRGGVRYQVPVPISDKRAQFLSMKWLIAAAREKDRKVRFNMQLARELIEAASNNGKVVKKKQDLHRQCEANRAYAHYRWS